MSQWTHLLGVVRYDSFAANVWPKPVNKAERLQIELDLVNNIWQRDLPAGSEGPLEVQVVQTGRGPTVFIVGDLRDFGREDLGRVLDWCNSRNKWVAQGALDRMIMLFVRDAIIHCDVEFDQTLYLIRDRHDVTAGDDNRFKLDQIVCLATAEQEGITHVGQAPEKEGPTNETL